MECAASLYDEMFIEVDDIGFCVLPLAEKIRRCSFCLKMQSKTSILNCNSTTKS